MLSLFWGWAIAAPDFSTALKEMSVKKVEYSASLGEGEGEFDPSPRYIRDKVNCMTWMQAVIASAYGKSEQERMLYLDSLRYYGNTVSFGTRKHYVDRWLALEPEPLISVKTDSCKFDIIGSVGLELNRFKQNHSYQGELYQEEHRMFGLDVLSSARMSDCLSSLDNGFYALFFVANSTYLEIWGKHGSMGQVHSMIVEITDVIRIHHASIDFGKVQIEDWSDLSTRLESVAQGYTIYAFAPEWTPKTMTAMSIDLKVNDKPE